jgi:Ulp1 family protease
MTEADIKTVEPGNFINDNVVNFWKELPNESLVHIFSTHFHTELASGGSVAHGTTNRGINLFQKKLIIIPINKQKHWSLFALMNHHYIDFGGIKLHSNHFQVLVLIMLDSLKLHSMNEEI